MGRQGFVCWVVYSSVVWTSSLGCKEPEPQQRYVEVASAHRACAEDEACAIVETSCVSQGCECGVAVNLEHLVEYQQKLAECRGQAELETCELDCKTPFAKCFEGVCVLTDQPRELFKRGRSVRETCEQSRGRYVGCPDCPPAQRCRSCVPCECPSTHRWSRGGCRRVVKTEARDIAVEVRPPRLPMARPLKARVRNESERTIWLKTLCGTPFYRARRKEDHWETNYELVPTRRCRKGSIEIRPGKDRPFVVKTLAKLSDPTGKLTEPGTYRYELTYTDRGKRFDHYDTVYSDEFDALSKRSRR